MNQDLELLVQFVSGKIEAKQFESSLYASSSIEEYLSDDPDLPAYSYIGGDNYLFLISQDYNDPGGILNAQGAVEEFLERKGVEFNKTNRHGEIYDIILKAQPRWLDIDSKHIAERYLPKLEGLTKESTIKKLQESLLKDFKCVNSQPKWIQSPAWPIVEGEPLIFLGQIEIEKYFHDTAAAYIFHNPKDDSIETVIQVS